MHTTQNAVSGFGSHAPLAGEFFSKLSPEALEDLTSMALACNYAAGKVLFSERDLAHGVYLVLEGEVKLSMNSSDGRRLTMRIARKGEILGLVSVLCGKPCEMTAEVLYPSRIAPIARRDFLNFLTRHPDAYQAVTEELSREYTTACEQLRTVGLSNSAPEKLARTESGTKFRFSLTHEEIGEFIGASRETVTRTLSIFKSRQLVAFHGSTLTIPSKVALETYAHC